MPQTSGLITVGTSGGVALATTGAASYDSGVQMNEAAGFKSWTFQAIGTFTGMSAQIFGTIDPAAKYLPNGQFAPHGTTIPVSSWFLLDAPSVATGGTEPNPIIATGTALHHSGLLVAVRVLITGASQTGVMTILGFASP